MNEVTAKDESVDATIDQCLKPLDEAIALASAYEDPIRLPLIAVRANLIGMKALFENGTRGLKEQILAAREPVQDAALRAAVIAGIQPHAASAVRAIRSRTIAIFTVIMAVSMLASAGLSWWIVREDADARVAAARAENIQAGETIQSAAGRHWAYLITQNGDRISEARGNCKEQSGGRWCDYRLWEVLPKAQ